MDTPILIILVLFAILVVVLGIRYRREIADEVGDLFDGEEDEAPPDVLLEDEVEAEPPSPAPEPSRQIPEPRFEAPPPQAPISPEDETRGRGPSRGGELPAPIPAPSGGVIVPEQVKFSAYYPRETAEQVWQPLATYVFRQSAAADVTKDASAVLGSRLSDFRRAEEIARQTLQEGAMITAIPTLAGFQVNPPQITLGFYEPFHRFEFKVRATSAPLDQAVNGTITFTVEGVIVADLPISIFVGRNVGESLTGAVTKPAYQSVFCSYSHKDTQIVERVERAYKALGLTYLRDVMSLRSGQEWDDELLRLIEKADIFQLFWSQASSESAAVRKEWQHAIETNRAIRPVFWEQPLPNIPEPLGKYHFAYMPDLGE